MVSFPNAKINLGLNIIEKRTDGYHNIESVFYPVAWCDALEIIKSDSFSFHSSGLKIPGNQENNLIVRAHTLLQNEGFLKGSQVNIHLHKVLPMGAGIGGGSADGAFALKMFNEIFELNLSSNRLENLAESLGSDCPFFIENKPKFCFGKGAEFEELAFSLKGKKVVLINPQIHISTAEAYAGVKPQKPEISVKDILSEPITVWKNFLKNDFEEKIIENHPKIGEIKANLYEKGALYASMTGSGSTVFGIFDESIDLINTDFEDCVCWSGACIY
ncbi:4-(cytidine 5'-diphospho)-2-C-methyl-D-erythritol kinase [Lacihabitans sp. CCS-44]|uniref:4-(cytidine 5'-diphospho)-2-C-methyl-D-erythritol kinase n=1 Tax=Lacihabitans sp. CCS-44 TaxID=2487331 RepID=UPI0020CB792A|nr:4-(cytidine 5'-diphospho)-2-C-methyl-D-erythritol kinase [Lacihabitans sp. CCS-44]MCP9753842.1 4-(cytidine 5'-diphospho)-2-C-methyl-D-erythritol kinase [Lacihabitans sp. CCS-44]